MILVAPPRRPPPERVLAPGVSRRLGHLDGLAVGERHAHLPTRARTELAAVGLAVALSWMTPALAIGSELQWIVELAGGAALSILAGVWIAAHWRRTRDDRRTSE